jgi:uridine kinase
LPTEDINGLLIRWAGTRPGRPPFIGIGGGSASGKSTIARDMAARLAPLEVQVIGQDRFFKPHDRLPLYPSRTRREPWRDHNHPDSFDLAGMLEACAAVDGADVIIFEGILALHYPEMRDLMDVKCYVEADADERIIRRTRRSLPHSSFDDITDFYLESVRHQHERYNAPTRAHADIVIPGGSERDEQEEREWIVADLCECIREAVEARRG